ncbi:MAG: ribonuclease BN [Rhodospirillaceae bacterium]|nr:ribonuclease BN [Rhodospirillaceae bacterium]
MAPEAADSLGRDASTPLAFPRRGWWQVLRRVYRENSADNLSVVAAGVAFYFFLAVFPGIAAFVTVYGLVADPAGVEAQIAPMRSVVPAEAYGILADQLKEAAQATGSDLTIGLLVSLGLALWSATKGSRALLTALDIAYEERDRRGFLKQNLMAIAFTLAAILVGLLALALIAVLPAVAALLGRAFPVDGVVLWLRWPLVAAVMILAFGALYRYGPSRRAPRLQWVTPGAILAVALWLAGSWLFSFYVSHFGSYNETFGSLGAVVVLLFWFYLSAYVVCLGAEFNSELEHQTSRDSTVGPDRPIGGRGAYVADHTAGVH